MLWGPRAMHCKDYSRQIECWVALKVKQDKKQFCFNLLQSGFASSTKSALAWVGLTCLLVHLALTLASAPQKPFDLTRLTPSMIALPLALAQCLTLFCPIYGFYSRLFPDNSIASVIAQVLGDDLVLNQFANIPDLQPTKRWTQSEAEDMAASDYRDRYLQQPSELADSPIEVKLQSSRTVLPNPSRARSHGAAGAVAKGATSSTSSLIDFKSPKAKQRQQKDIAKSLLDNIFAASHQAGIIR